MRRERTLRLDNNNQLPARPPNGSAQASRDVIEAHLSALDFAPIRIAPHSLRIMAVLVVVLPQKRDLAQEVHVQARFPCLGMRSLRIEK